MPTYLCHGFRWHRRGIRVFVIVNDLEDAAPDWIMGRRSAAQILGQFARVFGFLPAPGARTRADEEEEEAEAEEESRAGRSTERRRAARRLHHDDDFAPPPPRVAPAADAVLGHGWSAVKLLEEYDAEERASAARPYAYVADHVVRVDLSASVADEMAKYRGGGGWFERLRDELQAGEAIRWYVVVCADAERAVPGGADDAGLEPEPDEEEEPLPPPPPSKDLPVIMPPRPAPTPPAAAVARRSEPVPPPPPPPEFLGDDPFKAGRPPPGLRHRLSTKGLRRLFSKREAP